VNSILLVHGAGSGPWVFDDWSESFSAAHVSAVDLQAGLDVADAGIDDYARAIERAAEPLQRPLAVVAWSLGGLAAMVAAARVRPEALVLLEASPPLEVQGARAVDPQPGTFMPASPPAGVRSRPESLRAVGERERGVSVPLLPEETRTLVVFGDILRDDRGPNLARRYGADQLDVGSATHWDLVLDPVVRGQIGAWLDQL
jgi:pimeloyl-ACP methyl ester carboxylesterase